MLVKLEIPTETRLVKPLLKKLDKSGNGVVEYDEFKNFLFFDPYHIWFNFINNSRILTNAHPILVFLINNPE